MDNALDVIIQAFIYGLALIFIYNGYIELPEFLQKIFRSGLFFAAALALIFGLDFFGI